MHTIKNFFAFIIILFSASIHANTLIIEPNDGREPILQLMQQAKSIDLILYGLTDPVFIDALIHAKKSGKNVNVMLEPLPYKNATQNLDAIQKLKAANINVLTPNPAFQLLHQKTFIFDHQKALVMTMNLTKSSFKNQRNFAILIDDPSQVQEIEKIYKADALHQKVTPNHPNLIFSPDNSRSTILNFINHAEKEIKIYAQSVSDYQIIGALAKAAERGVKVEILTEGQNPTQKKWEFLKKSGVKICFKHRYFIHAKVIVIDKKIVILGSTNLTKPSFDKNRELNVFVKDNNIIDPLLKTFDNDWQCRNGSIWDRSS